MALDVGLHSLDIALVASNFLVNTEIEGDKDSFYKTHVVAFALHTAENLPVASEAFHLTFVVEQS